MAVVVLGYGEEPLLIQCLDSVRSQLHRDDDLILVDNGIASDVRRQIPTIGVRVVGDGVNAGFAEGCNIAARATAAHILVFLNSDAVLRAGALEVLAARLDEPGVGIVSGCLRLADQPDLVNSVGNPLQYLGFTWAGHCGEPAASYSESTRVAVATGGLFALTHRVWDQLGGFEPEYFAYHEDTDLSLRCWLAGYQVVVDPSAIADHAYEFSRNPRKLYLVERNRLITVLSDYPGPLLRRVLPALLAVELPLAAMALVAGWGRQKAAAWWWVARRWRWLSRRRRRVQRGVVVSPAAIVELLTAEISPPMVEQPPGMGLLNRMLAAYWRVVVSSLS